MKGIKVIKILLIAAFITGCQNFNIREKIRNNYKQNKRFFNSELVSHFPVELPDSCSFGATVPKKGALKMLGFGVDALLLWKKYSTSQYNEVSSKFKKLKEIEYLSTDTNLLLVFSLCFFLCNSMFFFLLFMFF